MATIDLTLTPPLDASDTNVLTNSSVVSKAIWACFFSSPIYWDTLKLPEIVHELQLLNTWYPLFTCSKEVKSANAVFVRFLRDNYQKAHKALGDRILEMEGCIQRYNFEFHSQEPKNTIKNGQNLSNVLGQYLIKVVAAGNLVDARKLLEAGANINVGSPSRLTALKQAVKSSDLKMVQMLLTYHPEVNVVSSYDSPLNIAARIGNLSILKELIKHGANVNFPTAYGATALMEASKYGRLAIVKELIQEGALVNVANINKATAFLLASEGGHVEVMQELINHGADVYAKTGDRWTALMMAARHNHLPAVEYLVHHGAHVNDVNDDATTAIQMTGNSAIEDFLVQHGAIKPSILVRIMRLFF